MPLTPEQQMWIDNGAQIGPDGVPFIEPGGYYIVNGVGQINQTGQNLPLFGALPANTNMAQIPDPLEAVLTQNNGGTPPPTVSQYFNSPDPAARYNPSPTPSPAPAPQTGNIGGLNQGFPNFSPASLFNLLLASTPPRPAPPGPNIFNPATFMAPVSTGGNSMFQLPAVNTQSQSDIASAFQPFQQNALRIGGSNLASAVPQVGVLGEPAQTLTGSRGTSSLAGGFNPAASLFNSAVQSPFSQTRTGK